MILRQRLINLRPEEGCSEEGLRQHLDTYRTLATQMESLGEVIGDGELVNWLFISLLASYELLIMALQSLATDPTFDFVSTRLVQEQTRRSAKITANNNHNGTQDVEMAHFTNGKKTPQKAVPADTAGANRVMAQVVLEIRRGMVTTERQGAETSEVPPLWYRGTLEEGIPEED